MEEMVGVRKLLQSPMTTYKLIWERCTLSAQSQRKGRKNGSFVKSYKLSFSTDESSWSAYREQNIDKAWNNSTLIFSSLFYLFVF